MSVESNYMCIKNCEFVCCCDTLSFLAGADYNSTTRLLTLNGSHTRIGIQVPIIQDGFAELNEQFCANLSLVDDNGIIVSVCPDKSMVEIINDDSKWKTEKTKRDERSCISSIQDLLLGLLKTLSQ